MFAGVGMLLDWVSGSPGVCVVSWRGRNEKDSLTDRDAKLRKLADTTFAVWKHLKGTGVLGNIIGEGGYKDKGCSKISRWQRT